MATECALTWSFVDRLSRDAIGGGKWAAARGRRLQSQDL